jgi:hypothetical protein
MIRPPAGIGTFEFVVLAALRVRQLTRGCRPRVAAHYLRAVTAQLEVAGGFIVRAPDAVRTAVDDVPVAAELIAIGPPLTTE